MDASSSDPRPVTKHPLPQTSFMQNAVPLLSSLLLHVGIVVLGISIYHMAVTHLVRKNVEETVIPISDAPCWKGDDNHVKFNGLGDDPDYRAEQMKFPDVIDSADIGKERGASLLPGGQAGDDGATDAMMLAIGPGGLPGHGIAGHRTGPGLNDGDNGRIGPWGPHTNGGMVKFGPQQTDARRVVFICDATGSMMENFDSLRRELRKAIGPMNAAQFANVVFMQKHAPAPLDTGLLRLTPENKRKLIAYVDNETPREGTDPDPALRTAFAMHPDVIFFLCDPSDFPNAAGTIELCRSLNPEKRTKIMTICFEDHRGEETLKQIASDSGGTHKFLTPADLGD